MRLASVQTVRELLRFDSMAKSDAAFSAALDHATEKLGAELRTTFNRETLSEVFYVRPGAGFVSGYHADSVFRFRFALKKGFLTANATAVYAASLKDLDENTVTALQTYELRTDLTKGEVTVIGPNLRNQYVKITYTAGFVAVGADYTVPSEHGWLQEAARGYAIAYLYTTTPEIIAGDDSGGASSGAKVIAEEAKNVAHKHVRYFPDAIRAVA